MRVANIVMAVLFFVSALLQYNDPDPLPWMALYGAAGAACLLRGRGRTAWLLPALVGGAALVWALAMAPYVLPHLRFGDLFQSMKAETPAIEENRELLGILIVAAWMAVLALTSLRRKSAI
jgi:hypothetical protein